MSIKIDELELLSKKNRKKAEKLADESGRPLAILAFRYFDKFLSGHMIEKRPNQDFGEAKVSVSPFTEEDAKELEEQSRGKDEDVDPIDDGNEYGIDELNLKTRPYNALVKAGITTPEQLEQIEWDELNDIKNIGNTSAKNVRDQMWEHGYALKGNTGPDLPGAKSPDKESDEPESPDKESGEPESSDGEEASQGYDYDDQLEDWYEELQGLEATQGGVKRSFEIFKEAWDFDTEQQAQKAAGELVSDVYKREDSDTYQETINRFEYNMPAKSEDIEHINEQIEDVLETDDHSKHYPGEKQQEQLTVSDIDFIQQKIQEVSDGDKFVNSDGNVMTNITSAPDFEL